MAGRMGRRIRRGRQPTALGDRLLRPLVWLLAMLWLALQAVGRGIDATMAAVDAGTAAVGRTAARAGSALVRSLGPLGRGLRRLLAPAWRGLRWAWDTLGRRVFLALARPLGRLGRRLAERLGPPVRRGLAELRRFAARAEPVLTALGTAVAVVERAAGRLAAVLRRAWTPIGRPVRRVVDAVRGRTTR
jgi:hypothetical protein